MSPRRDGPFVAVNCGAIRASCSRASCSATSRARSPARTASATGAFAAANGGTLFLDEIGEMPLALQVKLLRVLQIGEFKQVGGSETEHADVRMSAPPTAILGRGAGRAVPRRPLLPPACRALRDAAAARARRRPAAVGAPFPAAYADEEGKSFDRFRHGNSRALHRYAWPGNIRELQNVLRNVVLFNPGGR